MLFQTGSQFIANNFSIRGWSDLEDYEGDPEIYEEAFAESLANEFNRLMGQVYEAERFTNIALSLDTSALLSQVDYSRPGLAEFLMNRLALSDAYPAELSGASSGDFETAINPFSWADMLPLIWNGGTVTKSVAWGPITIRAAVPAKSVSATNSFQRVGNQSTAGLSNVANDIQLRLRELQRRSYSHLLSGLSEATSLQASAQQLSGAKALIDSFIVFGFSQSLEGNDFIHSLLSGGERVLDTDAVRDLCQLGIARTYDTNQSAKVDIAAILDERINALESWVSNRLTQVQTNGRAESLRLVSSTLSRLDAFRAGWSQPTPAPYLAPLGLRLTNGVPNRLFIVWGEPNLRYTIQSSTNLTQWADLPTPANEGADYITTPTGRSAFYRAVLRP